MNRNHRAWVVAALMLLFAAAGCAAEDAAPRWRVEVLGTRPHDAAAFTQGLEIDGPVLYESTGMWGHSTVRAYELATGTERARTMMPGPLFGEGIARAGDILWQLTWQDHLAFDRDPVTLAERRQVHYEGEGWGLCTHADRLVMSNGTNTLTFRDPVTFAATGSVTLDRTGVHLNELECAEDGSVYANDWPGDEILRVDPDTGHVLAAINAAGLLSPADRAGTDVLNGIAQIPGTDRFLITGKRWPKTFEVRFVPA